MITVKVVSDQGQKTGIKVSQQYEGDCNKWSNHELNQRVSVLLAELAKQLAIEDEYEFDGVGEAEMGGGVLSITCGLFVP